MSYKLIFGLITVSGLTYLLTKELKKRKKKETVDYSKAEEELAIVSKESSDHIKERHSEYKNVAEEVVNNIFEDDSYIDPKIEDKKNSMINELDEM
jgi:hypothetical protein